MIVEPDFLTHWKTRALTRKLEYEAAPMCVLSLWSHCQQRKTDRFAGMTPEVFASICAYPFGECQRFYDAMLECGFVELEGDIMVVHDFAKSNAQLFANWQNGLRGGRPSRTSDKPVANPTLTHRKPIPEMGKPIDKIREEKIDKSTQNGAAAPLVAFKRQPFYFPAVIDTPQVREEWSAFVKVRKVSKHPLTDRAQELILAKLASRPSDAVAALQMTLERGWRGFEWAWFDEEKARLAAPITIRGKPMAPVQQRKIDKEYEQCMAERSASGK